MRKICLFIILLLTAPLLAVPAFASQNATITVSASDNTICPGETFTVNISSTSIENCVVGGFMFQLDANIFEYVEGKACVSGFSATGISTANSRIAGYFMGGEGTILGDIFQITLKVKDDAPCGDYAISGTPRMMVRSGETQESINCSVENTKIAVIYHNYGDWRNISESQRQRECSNCQHIDTEYIDYTITFQDYDGSVLSKETCHWGQRVVAPSSPTRAPDEACTYTFTGWDHTVVNCAGDATYTATYTKSYIDYTVVFQDWNGNIISKNTCHWGDPIPKPVNPTREADNTYTYAFSGWDKTNTHCEGDATFTASYTPIYIEYTVIFQDWDGTVLATNTYHWGDAVTAPADPVRPEDNGSTYTFAGWDKAVSACSGDTTYTATYTQNKSDFLYSVQNKKITITGYIGNDTQLVVPSKIGSYAVIAIGSEAFAGFTSLTHITLPKSVTTIGWGAFQDCANLTAISIPDGVTAIDSFTFSGCEALTSISIPDSVTEINISAFANCRSLESVTIPSGITYINASAFSGCSSLKSIHIPGSVTAIYDNAFAGCDSLSSVIYCGTEESWSSLEMGMGNEILSNVTLQLHAYEKGECTLCQHRKDYTISFVDWDGTVLSTGTYQYGDKVNAPTSPSKVADNTYTYTFKGWDKTVVKCAGDAIYTAVYKENYINYTVVFQNWNADVISSKTYHYGDPITIPTTPKKAADNTYTYTFSGWDNAVVDCAGNATYTATYTPSYIDYTVVFKDWNGTVLSTDTYHYGDKVPAPADPVRNATNTYTYTFLGWDAPIVDCSGNATYTAVYQEFYIDYTIIFKDWNGEILSSQIYHYGDKVTAPPEPTRAADETYNYAFKKWDKTVVKCAGDATYTATYKETYINYTVIFQNWNGDVLSTKSYHYGDKVMIPKEPTKAADDQYRYTFSGWNKEVTNCTGDAVYTATFTKHLLCNLGDIDGNAAVTEEDVVYLLLHTMFGESYYPVNAQSADVDSNGSVNQEDAVFLLLHTLFGEEQYPLLPGKIYE